MGEIVLPDVGLHSGVPFPDYLSWPAASNSALGKLLQSEAHLRAYLDGEDDDSKAKRIGRGTHAAVFEPGIFGEAYVTANGCDFATRSGKICSNSGSYLLGDGRWACGTHVKGFEDRVLEDVVVLSEAEAETIAGAREAVFAHPYARELIEADGESEVSGLWLAREDLSVAEEEGDGIPTKFRADHVVRSRGIALDLKTTEDASWPAFEREVWKWGYHRQGALYLSGLQALGVDVGHFVIVAVEKTPPFGVQVYRLTEGVLDAGEEEATLLLRLWKRAFERDEWPGYPVKIRDLSLPAFAWTQVDERLDLLRERLAA